MRSMDSQGMKISVICHGNIARSQILHHYLERYAQDAGTDVDVFSCGTASAETYPNAQQLLLEVQNMLRLRGLDVVARRNVLNNEALSRLSESDLVLVADEERRREVLSRMEEFSRETHTGKVYLFYEYIGEGSKNFTDTYDPSLGAQDPARFNRCFDELERIARSVIHRITS